MSIVPAAVSDKNRIIPPELNVPPRLLLGPGPSNANPRVLQALAMSPVGHLDPYFGATDGRGTNPVAVCLANR